MDDLRDDPRSNEQPPTSATVTGDGAAGSAPSANPTVGTEAAASEAKPAEPAASEPAKPASHDTPPPKALLDFMITGWRREEAAPPEPIAHHEAFRARRRALSELFAGDVLVIPTGHEKVRANDTHFRFRPGSDFYYLTGALDPDCVLVLEPKEGGGHLDILFVEPNVGRTDATFFTDRVKGELWVGSRLGVPECRARYQVDECRPLGELAAYLESVAANEQRRTLRGFSPKVDAALAEQDGDKKLAEALAEKRLLKDAIEVAELKISIAATKRGFEDVIVALRKATREREVEGVFNLRARVEGNDVGYGTIAASGHNACVLHWTRNDGPLKDGDLLLLDAGVEGHTLYTADITRSLPVSGRFSKAQKTIYKLVLKAQKAAMEQVKPGNEFMDPNKAAMRVIAEGLVKIGVLKGSAEDALKDDSQLYKRYSLHNVSHMLGLDVHDCAKARQESYKHGKLVAGMVLTIEPGLYFQENDLTVPEAYRGIGVRIEDDVLVTDAGCEVLSAEIPKELGAIEDWMDELWRGKKRKARA